MASLWPFFDLRLRTPRLELRVVRDDDLPALLRMVRERGLHGPDDQPFPHGWTSTPSPEMERGYARRMWRHRSELRPERWRIPLVALHEGELVGDQSIFGLDFHTLGVATTGSFLARDLQGRGLGKEMRRFGRLQEVLTILRPYVAARLQ